MLQHTCLYAFLIQRKYRLGIIFMKKNIYLHEKNISFHENKLHKAWFQCFRLTTFRLMFNLG